MTLSIAEKSYLYDSLIAKPSIRPDGRQPHQLRPVDIHTGFLQSSDGSSRVITSDGSECIVSIKSRIVDHTTLEGKDDLVAIEIDIPGERDDSVLVESCNSLFTKALRSIDRSKLQLTQKYSFKIFVDVLVPAYNAYPVSLISFGIYTALNCTYLPKLISGFDDLEVEELPMFHDYDLVKLDVKVPLLFVLAVVGNNILIDPATNESEVANNGLVISWLDGRIISPIRTVALNTNYIAGFQPEVIKEGANLVRKYAPEVAKALSNL